MEILISEAVTLTGRFGRTVFWKASSSGGAFSVLQGRIKDMFSQLLNFTSKPELYSQYTADHLWTNEHLSKKMLEFHLSEESALASRPMKSIRRITQSLNATFELKSKKICDLGCGPGLYTHEFAKLGGIVTGIDFSKNSIEYAKSMCKKENLKINYELYDYLGEMELEKQDIVTLIYFDLCVLSPNQRVKIYKNIRRILKEDGILIIEILSPKMFERVVEKSLIEQNYMNGFWSQNSYIALHATHRYEKENVSLDRFTVFEENKIWEIFNWFKYFEEIELKQELYDNGFRIHKELEPFDLIEDKGSFAGGTSFAVSAKPFA